MPRAETNSAAASRAKSVPHGSSSPPSSPHRVRLPATPAATSRANPIDQPRSAPVPAPTAPKDKDKDKKDESVKLAAASSQAGSQLRVGVTRTPSASTTASLQRAAAAAAAEEELKAKKEKEKTEKPPIDMATFEQILELDEDDPERSFSQGIVDNYHEQVETTFDEMEEALKNEDMAKLSSLGHFLKGSSAALGVTKVQATCESMQHYGHLKTADGSGTIEKKDAVAKIAVLVPRVRVEYQEAKVWFDDCFSKPA